MCHNCTFMCHNWGCRAGDSSGRLWTQVSRGLLGGASRCFDCDGLQTWAQPGGLWPLHVSLMWVYKGRDWGRCHQIRDTQRGLDFIHVLESL